MQLKYKTLSNIAHTPHVVNYELVSLVIQPEPTPRISPNLVRLYVAGFALRLHGLTHDRLLGCCSQRPSAPWTALTVALRTRPFVGSVGVVRVVRAVDEPEAGTDGWSGGAGAVGRVCAGRLLRVVCPSDTSTTAASSTTSSAVPGARLRTRHAHDHNAAGIALRHLVVEQVPDGREDEQAEVGGDLPGYDGRHHRQSHAQVDVHDG